MTAKSKKTVLGVIVALVALIAILGTTGPKHTHAESSIVINRPVSQVFSYLLPLKNGEQWSPWSKMDPTMKIDYQGADGAIGSSLNWVGNSKVGEGTQTLTAVQPDKRLEYRLEFRKPMAGVATAYFTTDAGEQPNTTKVTWGLDADNTNFVQRLMARVMNCEGMMEKIFAGGLVDLKTALEK